MRNHSTLKNRLLCLLLALSLISASLTACQSGKGSDPSTESTQPSATQPVTSAPTDEIDPEALSHAEQERFTAYTYDLFLESVLDNTVNLHYTLADPESFGITE